MVAPVEETAELVGVAGVPHVPVAVDVVKLA